MFWLLTIVALAHATPPAFRCEAVFSPVPSQCPLTQRASASGFGRSEARATESASQRLEGVVGAQALARAERATGTLAESTARAEVEVCVKEARAHAEVYCYREPTLRETRLCVVEFEAPGCGPRVLKSTEGVVWKVNESAREAECQKLTDSLTAASAEQTAQCRAQCLEQLVVRCPQ